MEWSTEICDDKAYFRDRWQDGVTFELNSQGRVEVILNTGDSVLLEKPQVISLINTLVKHVASE